jgi:ribonucleoside-diphosphate reductase alpha chain
VPSQNALRLLEDRYFYQYPDHKETLDEFYDRISMGNPEYQELLASGRFLPNSPTLFNLGIPGAGTLSACFKFDIDDTLLDGPDSIMATGMKAAAVTKWGGGTGFVFSALRGKNEPVRTTHGKAMGPVAVMRYLHAVGNMITQAGKREAAQMGILDVTHPDIMDFIHCKDDDPQALSTFNISVAIPDTWMHKAVLPGTPENALLREIVASAWKTGDPGVFFVDAAERANPTPWLGKLTGTNPCGEVPLLNNEPCNLGSLNLAAFVDDDGIDYHALLNAVRVAIRYLDDVLDANVFPVQDIEDAAFTTRKLGLGVCGWADLLALLGIHYDTQEAVNLGENLMRLINLAAREESHRLALSKGVAPAFEGTDTVLRNATRTCIAPTGTIAILMDASSGIEPHFATEWTRTLGNGQVMFERIPVMDRVKAGFVPKTSMEIAPEWHVAHQAAFQKHTDLAVSKTINLPNGATEEDIFNIYTDMFYSGCKGGTVYRDGCRNEQVLNAAVTSALGLTVLEFESCPACEADVVHAEGCVECAARCGWSACAT